MATENRATVVKVYSVRGFDYKEATCGNFLDDRPILLPDYGGGYKNIYVC